MALRFFKEKLTGGGVDIKSAVVAGAAPNTLIAIAAMKADAQIIAVVMFAAGVPSDRQVDTTVATGGGGIKIANATTAGNTLIVSYAQSA